MATLPPDPSTLEITRILLASEGRPISPQAFAFAVELARSRRASVHVFSVARVWGTALGFPSPGLMPTRREWDEQRGIVTSTVKQLKQAGVKADGHVLGTRKAAKRIVREAQRHGCDVIVMGADPERNRILGDLLWSQEPYRVRRRARVPVYLIQ